MWKKIKECVIILAEILGGWWSAMSGAISIPFAFVAAFSTNYSAKCAFLALAYVGLLICVCKLATQNFERHKQDGVRAKRWADRMFMVSLLNNIQEHIDRLKVESDQTFLNRVGPESIDKQLVQSLCLAYDVVVKRADDAPAWRMIENTTGFSPTVTPDISLRRWTVERYSFLAVRFKEYIDNYPSHLT